MIHDYLIIFLRISLKSLKFGLKFLTDRRRFMNLKLFDRLLSDKIFSLTLFFYYLINVKVPQ